MTEKIVYQASPQGLYIGPVLADPCPIEEGVFLVPAGCVEVAPPDAPEHKVAHWNGKKWQLLDYFEKVTVYSITTGESLVLDGMRPMPSGYTLKQPGPNQIWKGGKWVDDVEVILASLYQKKLAAIGADCSSYIQGGFSSQALGWSFRYASELEDQLNLTGLILAQIDADYPCYDEHQVKAFRPHTAEQLQEVGKDLAKFRQVALQHAESLKQELAKALEKKDIKAMQTITWAPSA
ncbi:hypothetical protein C1Y08_07700 [Pseudomonas sp. FW306-02-F02-AA]|uniref:DUF4376 domain-containing protein n=1 Tax=Pseudomonas fluorescens TaxID=294 RepID=A0A0N9VN10_PSEFL|nr:MULTISPECIES: hypothetical protein [Pseudomonas]ALH99519.1 hypothetical protein AO353_00130 [Pseudomonas fluorescens]PMZ04613.1 hypothetical protein C1Y07_07775 [Pseudomonas sp. FW306-02-F02-AB]PMZ07415.1 hypothetical protein C1Y06_24675 [Pseudomonas sp. FW306-02-H06C]PMZ16663.1 hypothetical protein C1Y08_07700 [Pseudomonas sp. FW306-02-F02-AA]PMZ19065.1 hypothetical protein C1Y09_26065 [Pseudomonas sp. FW306-02-F08-AA]